VTPAADRPLHPTPQFTRERWTDLCGTWDFAYDDDDCGRTQRWFDRDDAWPLRIEVPYPPESERSGIGDRAFHPVVWYRRRFAAEVASGERLLLHFGAVDYRAEVWVNGQLVVRHEGGHTPFCADITDVLRSGDRSGAGSGAGAGAGDAVVVVRAEDLPTDLAQPRGKQDFREEPHKIWYERTTGIWQPVWLEPVPARRIRAVRFTTDLDRGTLRVHVRLHDVTPGCQVRIRVSLRDLLLAEDSYSVTAGGAADGVTRDVLLSRGEMGLGREEWLWSPRYPNLMDVDLTLVDEAGDTLDNVYSYAGFRSVGTSANRFVLNGRPYFLRLVLAQGYWPESHLAAPSPDALRREVELVRELGFNGVRLHQKVEDPRFLYWCDRLGVAVWAEMPAAYAWSPAAAVRTTREWMEVLDRDASVPSIVAWVPVNESWGVPGLQSDPAQRAYVHALYSLAKALDSTRPVVGNDGWEHVVTDMITIHDYAGDGQTLRERYGSLESLKRALKEVQPLHRPVLLPGVELGQEPILLTEFGGISYQAGTDFWNGYGTATDADDFVRRYRDLLDAVIESPVLAGYCYTQLTDTEQERNGLLTEHREPKADLGVLKEITRRHSAAVPGDVVAAFELGDHDGLVDPHATSQATATGGKPSR